MSVVQCLSLTKSYRNIKAIDNLSINIDENRITGLIGRNGAGKTTLLKLIAGYLKPTSGSIKVFSKNPFNNIEVSADMIFIDDQMAFPSSLFLDEILNIAGTFYSNWDRELAFRLLDYFSLNPKQSHSWLSKGTQSTFNVIIGLASHCPLTIFDEPTTGMDAGVRKDFYRALLKDYIDHPRTIIFSSHLLNEIENILEDILLIKNGSKVLHLPVTELKDYALGLRGNTQVLDNLLDDKLILHRENFAPDNLFAVVKNNYSDSELYNLKKAGIQASAVAAEDLCIYLTGKTKGGIDDVFSK